jgi:hypothetical protein
MDDISAIVTGTDFWKPIAFIPVNRLDGRDVLLWNGRIVLGSYCDEWCDAVGRPVGGVTHYADVEGPTS